MIKRFKTIQAKLDETFAPWGKVGDREVRSWHDGSVAVEIETRGGVDYLTFHRVGRTKVTIIRPMELARRESIDLLLYEIHVEGRGLSALGLQAMLRGYGYPEYDPESTAVPSPVMP